jgi:chromosome segregation ATPase
MLQWPVHKPLVLQINFFYVESGRNIREFFPEMYYFLSKCWRCSKLLVASTLTAASGGTVLYGTMAAAAGTSGIVIALGSIGLVGSLLLFYESCRVQSDIARAIAQNEKLIEEFKVENTLFHTANGELQQSIDRLQSSLKRSAIEVEKLNSMRLQLAKALEDHQSQFSAEKAHFEQRSAAEQLEFQTQMQALNAAHVHFQQENLELKNTLASAQENTVRLEQLYQGELARASANQAQIAKLKLIVDSMQQMLSTVTDQGENFESFNVAMGNRLAEMDRQNNMMIKSIEMMEKVLSDLQEEKFELLDADQNGSIDKSEFDNFFAARAADANKL